MAADEQRRLYRSRSEKMPGGMGEHWNVDPCGGYAAHRALR
jgi:hypothetical protein